MGKLPEAERDKGRTLGLLLAVVSRILLVLAIGWVMTLTKVLFVMLGHQVTGKDLILIFGGLFLVFKGTKEIHHKMQDAHNDDSQPKKLSSLKAVLFQILMIDVVFSWIP